MDVSDVRRRADRLPRGHRPVFDLVASKLRQPLVRPGTIRRSLLLERLRRDTTAPVVSVVAPPGYGKTTLLSQWAERSGQSFAWVSVEERDNDPKILLTYVAEALDAVEPVDERVFDALASPASSVPGTVVPRLGAAFSSMTSPVVLVLDDVHVLHNWECRAAVSMLADHVPAGSRLALAGQAEPPLRIEQLRAEGKLLEVDAADLSLTDKEASSLLRNAEVTLGEDDVTELNRRIEGWPAGLYLAALYLKEEDTDGSATASFGGDDRLVSEYLESEFLAGISSPQRTFLTRTAVLDRMCGPLCDAVLEQSESAAALADLERSNLLLIPLDRRREWYRNHHLLRDVLLAELHRVEPDLVPVLHRRAAQWHERDGARGEALEHWMRANDTAAASRLIAGLAVPTYQSGRVATAERWFGWLEDREALADQPAIAVLAAILSALTGKAANAERWAAHAERETAAATSLPDGSPSIGPWLALLRALLCRDGVEQMRAHARLATKTVGAQSFWRTASILFLGMAHLMADDPDQADVLFAHAAAAGQADGANIGACVALAERSLLAIDRGAWNAGRRYVSEARSAAQEANLADYPPIAILHAAAAQIAIHEANPARARLELTRAQRARPGLTYALPHLAVQTRIELARCYVALSDLPAARVLLREADGILKRRPRLGVFIGQADDLRKELSSARGASAPGITALTDAELRLLPMLATYLTFQEIAAEMFLSRNTIKTEANSIYRKLGVTSRSQAVARSRELRLLEG